MGVAQIADQKIAFEDLNDQQLGVIGSVIGALQTGAIKSSDSDKDYIQLNIAPEAPKVPSGLYASVEMDPSAGYYAPQGYPQYSQNSTRLPVILPDTHPHTHPDTHPDIQPINAIRFRTVNLLIPEATPLPVS